MLRILLLFFLLLNSLYAEEYEGEESSEYTLGEGIQAGSLPLYLGGYFSTDFRHKDGEHRYRVDDIALLAYGNYNKFSYMSELEFKEFYAYNVGDGYSYIDKDTSLHVERLFVDYTLNENYMFRLGKYNSPIGFWNLLPINVLRDTSSNPISTEKIFPKFTTGALLSYTSFEENELQIDVILQENRDVDPSYNNYEMDEHYGIGISYSYDFLTLKLNAGMFDNLEANNINTHLYYALASLKYETESFKILAELGSQNAKDYWTTKYAGYLQASYNITDKHMAIVRTEAYDEQRSGMKDEMGILAYTYRPLYPVAIKSEYQFHTLHNENQFIFSFSVLF